MSEPFEPVFSGFHHTRGQRTFSGGNSALFPANHTANVSWAAMFLDPYNPLHPPLRSGIPYEDLITVLYNVKEWRFSGTIGSNSFNGTVPAGCCGDYDLNDPAIITTEPNGGDRGIYAVRFNYYARTETATTDDVCSVSVGIGASTVTGTAPTGVKETISPSSATNPYTFIPYIEILMSHGFTDDDTPANNFNRIINAKPNTTPVPVEDADVTFLGIPLHTYPSSDGTPSVYSLEITAESFWTTTDAWVQHWEPTS
jgi:hypothetical protein